MISTNQEKQKLRLQLIGLGDLGSLDFASFPNLEELNIDNCKLEGSISEKIGLLSNLTYLSLRSNHLT
ncbi:kinase-like domain-containing protein, partial [Tanacetum coccineum]